MLLSNLPVQNIFGVTMLIRVSFATTRRFRSINDEGIARQYAEFAFPRRGHYTASFTLALQYAFLETLVIAEAICVAATGTATFAADL